MLTGTPGKRQVQTQFTDKETEDRGAMTCSDLASAWELLEGMSGAGFSGA